MALSADQVLQILNEDKPVDYATLTLCVIIGSDSGLYPEYDLGEILIVDRESRREPWGLERKPWKDGYQALFTDDWDAAHALSTLVASPDLQLGVYGWDGERWTLTDREPEFLSPVVVDLREVRRL